jgi:hypothetical protein
MVVFRPTPYVASLRVYEPLDSFEPSDQARWLQFKSQESTSYEEQVRALRRTIFPEPSIIRNDGAHIIDHDGKTFVAPWSTAGRCWAALEDFKSSLPSSVTPYFLTPGFEEVLRNSGDNFGGKIPHILTETWLIPPRWFALFEPTERLRGVNEDGAFSLARTELALAKKRCINAHMAVRRAFGPGPVEAEVIELLNWLNVFDPRSIVELDYGGLAIYLDKALRNEGEEGISADSSIEDVNHSIAGLAAGDGVMAGEGYERLVTRWRMVSALEQAM